MLPCHMHTNLNFWKFEFFFFQLRISLRFFFFFWGVYSRLIVNSIHYIFLSISIYSICFFQLYPFYPISYVCLFYLLQVNCQIYLFYSLQVNFCGFVNLEFLLCIGFFFVVYVNVLFGFYCCPCPWSIVSKSLFWRNILQN